MKKVDHDKLWFECWVQTAGDVSIFEHQDDVYVLRRAREAGKKNRFNAVRVRRDRVASIANEATNAQALKLIIADINKRDVK